ncbi:MarR family winged helix-turn-helix transcriptional regulator [Amycolatopsis benzoatilytica]|uniref:MarR family winged helix-turn-helix transcriptional regulator n=1 Tax=Amycolatopsis benzoatilytica TaxID=346045 RepID=UPI000361C2CB|nr:MarR family transcriptional regulator [Amycolatopsis benzoatilytica]
MEELEEAAARLRGAIRVLARRAESVTAAGGLTGQQQAVLGWLSERGALTAKELADLERVRPQSMAHVVDALVTRGWAARLPDAEDRRRVLLSLTESGAEALAHGRELRQAWLVEAMRTRLNEAERAELVAVIGLLERLGVTE